MRQARGEDGWTLLELMAVVLILGILVSIAIGTYSLAANRARTVTCQSNQRILNTAVMSYEQEHDGLPPADLAALHPYVATENYDHCPTGVALSYDATTGLVTCPVHPPQ